MNDDALLAQLIEDPDAMTAAAWEQARAQALADPARLRRHLVMDEHLSRLLDPGRADIGAKIRFHLEHQVSSGRFVSSITERIHADQRTRRSNRVKKQSGQFGASRRIKKQTGQFGPWWIAVAASLVFAVGWLLFAKPEITKSEITKSEFTKSEFTKSESSAVIRQSYAVLETAGPVVQVIRDGRSIAGSAGMALYAQDQIVVDATPSDHVAEVRYPDHTLLQVQSSTALRLWDDNGAKRVHLDHGEIQCEVEHQPIGKSMRLITNQAEAEVVGTQFTLFADNAQTRLAVERGEISLRRADGKAIAVQAGNMAAVGDGIAFETTAIGHNKQSILFEEHFDDSNLVSRGWYNITTVQTTAAEHSSGSSHAAEFHFHKGEFTPDSIPAAVTRRFPASDRVYVSFWMKHSADFTFTGPSAIFNTLVSLASNEDGAYPSLHTHLSVFIAQNKGIPALIVNDGKNIDQAQMNQDLTQITEHRAIAGGNGVSAVERATRVMCTKLGPDAKELAGRYTNDKEFSAERAYFKDDIGPYYKADWHHVEVFAQLNSITNEKGNYDGILRYWYDGELVVERTQVIMRTGIHPNLKFDKFSFVLRLLDRAQVDESIWIDNLQVATEKP